MLHTIESLEKALRLWEDNCLIINFLGRAENKLGKKQSFPLQGPFVHFAELRRYIIKSFPNFDSADFCSKFMEQRDLHEPSLLGDLAELPFELCLWSHTSRRAYHLKSDLQLMLNATSINNVTWQQVKLPFDSFAIILDEPIIGKTAKQYYDCLLISTYEAWEHNVITIRLFSTKVKDYLPLSEETKAHLLKLLKKRHFEKFLKALKRCSQNLPEKTYIPHFDMPLSDKITQAKVTEPITKLAQEFINDQNKIGISVKIPDEVVVMPDEGNTAIRLVVGLCLFLTTKHAKQNSGYTYHPAKKDRLPNYSPIIDGSEIFKLTLGQTLNVRERNSFSSGLKKNSGYTLDPHFRQGTWRFPPNKANDPSAEKTVWVRPTFVNAHLCTSSLPNGSKTMIKP